MLLFGTASVGLAQSGERCGENHGGKGVLKTCVDEILGVEEDILENLGTVVQDLEARNVLRSGRGESIGDKINRLKKARDRGQGENDDLEEGDYEQLTGTSYKKSCNWEDSFVEPESLRNGQCDKHTDPTTGEVVNERKENLCEKVCELSAGGNARKDRKKERIRDELTDTLAQLEEVNAELENEVAARVSLDFGLAPDEVCPASYSFLGSVRMSTGLTFGFFIASSLADAARDVGERFCDATVSGFNGAAACSVFEIIHHTLKGAFEALNAINEDINEAELAATYLCAKEIKKATDKAAGDIEEVRKAIVQMQAAIGRVEILLKTPPGRREGYPFKGAAP
jgi:hypothetical protein